MHLKVLLTLLLVNILLTIYPELSFAQDNLSSNELTLTLSVESAGGSIELRWILENISSGTLKVLKRWWNPLGDKINNINFFTLRGRDTVWSPYEFAPPYGEINQYDFKIISPGRYYSDSTPELHPYYSPEIRVRMPLGTNYAYAIYSMENITGFGNVWNGTIKSNTVCFEVYEVLGIHQTNWRALKSWADYRNLENLIK
jgi:hypothetical protein